MEKGVERGKVRWVAVFALASGSCILEHSVVKGRFRDNLSYLDATSPYGGLVSQPSTHHKNRLISF